MQRRVRVRVLGRVQGVGYRWFAANAARRLGLAGWVRNAMDGAVEMTAAGPAVAVEQLLVDLRRGPAQADVRALQVDDASAEDVPLRTPFEITP
jgi:acylphosphatase